MKKFINFASVLSLVVLFLAIHSCKDDDTYDWNSIDAGKQKISRADADTAKVKLDSMKGDMITIKNYVAISRGGSSYTWVASNEYLKITPNSTKPFEIEVKADSKVDTFSWIKVEETTQGGKVSLPDSLKILITGYCAYNIDELLGSGSFSSKMTSYAAYDVSLSKMEGDTIVNSNFFNMKWPVKYVLSKDNNEKVSIVSGQRFVYNEETVVVKGSGTYNTCKGRFEIKYAITHIAGDTIQFGSGTEVLTRK